MLKTEAAPATNSNRSRGEGGTTDSNDRRWNTTRHSKLPARSQPNHIDPYQSASSRSWGKRGKIGRSEGIYSKTTFSSFGVSSLFLTCPSDGAPPAPSPSSFAGPPAALPCHAPLACMRRSSMRLRRCAASSKPFCSFPICHYVQSGLDYLFLLCFLGQLLTRHFSSVSCARYCRCSTLNYRRQSRRCIFHSSTSRFRFIGGNVKNSVAFSQRWR